HLLASVARDDTLQLWNLEQLQAAGEVIATFERWPYTVAFDPGGSRLVTGSVDETVSMWSLAESMAVDPLSGHEGTVYAVAFTPDGSVLASGGADGSIRL